jgi:hypothetical protein
LAAEQLKPRPVEITVSQKLAPKILYEDSGEHQNDFQRRTNGSTISAAVMSVSHSVCMLLANVK